MARGTDSGMFVLIEIGELAAKSSPQNLMWLGGSSTKRDGTPIPMRR
jgi:hypothetical protein